jgi:hypothetical protein
MVLSIDGRGTVTVHLPLAGTDAAQLSKDGDTTLGSSYALDDAPAYERILPRDERPTGSRSPP